VFHDQREHFAVIIVLRQKGLIGEGNSRNLNGFLYQRSPRLGRLLLLIFPCFRLRAYRPRPVSWASISFFPFADRKRTIRCSPFFAVLYIVPALLLLLPHCRARLAQAAGRSAASVDDERAGLWPSAVAVFVTLAAGFVILRPFHAVRSICLPDNKTRKFRDSPFAWGGRKAKDVSNQAAIAMGIALRARRRRRRGRASRLSSRTTGFHTKPVFLLVLAAIGFYAGRARRSPAACGKRADGIKRS